jgi:hypothetical protein
MAEAKFENYLRISHPRNSEITWPVIRTTMKSEMRGRQSGRESHKCTYNRLYEETSCFTMAQQDK